MSVDHLSSSHGARLLKMHRIRHDMTLEKLGIRAGFDRSYLTRVEAGDRWPTRTAVQRLVVALSLHGVDATEMFLAFGYFPTVTALPTSRLRAISTFLTALLEGEG